MAALWGLVFLFPIGVPVLPILIILVPIPAVLPTTIAMVAALRTPPLVAKLAATCSAQKVWVLATS